MKAQLHPIDCIQPRWRVCCPGTPAAGPDHPAGNVDFAEITPPFRMVSRTIVENSPGTRDAWVECLILGFESATAAG